MERGGVVAVLPAPSQQSCRDNVLKSSLRMAAKTLSWVLERGREGRVNHSCGIMYTQTLLRNPLRT